EPRALRATVRERSLTVAALKDRSPAVAALKDRSPAVAALRDRSLTVATLKDRSLTVAALRDRSPAVAALKDRSLTVAALKATQRAMGSLSPIRSNDLLIFPTVQLRNEKCTPDRPIVAVLTGRLGKDYRKGAFLSKWGIEGFHRRG